MAKGHWLDPLARALLEATGQIRARPRPTPRAVAPASQEPGAGAEAAAHPAIERDLLALKLAQNPGLRLRSAEDVAHAAALGWRLDVNRATAADWLRLPGCTPAQVDLLLRLQAGGVQLSGPEDLQRVLELGDAQLRCWLPLLEFRWYGDGAPPQPPRLDLNRVGPDQLRSGLGLDAERCQRLLRERSRGPFRDLADLQQRLQLPPAVVESLIGRVRFGQGPVGPDLPRPGGRSAAG